LSTIARELLVIISVWSWSTVAMGIGDGYWIGTWLTVAMDIVLVIGLKH
jgi:hypothetical protein